MPPNHTLWNFTSIQLWVSQKYAFLSVCESLLAFLTQFEHAQLQQSNIMTGVRAHNHVPFLLFICHFVGEPQPGKEGEKWAVKEDMVVRNVLSVLPVQSESDGHCWALVISSSLAAGSFVAWYLSDGLITTYQIGKGRSSGKLYLFFLMNLPVVGI